MGCWRDLVISDLYTKNMFEPVPVLKNLENRCTNEATSKVYCSWLRVAFHERTPQQCSHLLGTESMWCTCWGLRADKHVCEVGWCSFGRVKLEIALLDGRSLLQKLKWLEHSKDWLFFLDMKYQTWCHHKMGWLEVMLALLMSSTPTETFSACLYWDLPLGGFYSG